MKCVSWWNQLLKERKREKKSNRLIRVGERREKKNKYQQVMVPQIKRKRNRELHKTKIMLP